MKALPRKLSRQEKALFAAPLVFGVGALALYLGPKAYYRASGQARILSTPPTNTLTEFSLSADGSVLAVTGIEEAAFKNPISGSIYFWDAKDFSEKPLLKSRFGWDSWGHRIGYWVHALSLSPDGEFVGVAFRGGENFEVYSRDNQKPLWKAGGAWHSQFSRDGRYIAFGTFEMREVKSGKVVAQWRAQPGSSESEFALSPHNRTLAWIGKKKERGARSGLGKPLPPNGAAIEIRRISDGKVLRILQDSQETSTVAFSPDGQKIVSLAQGSLDTGSSDGPTVRCHDISGRLVWEKEYRRSSPNRVREDNFSDATFSPDGKYIALLSSGGKGGVVLLDAASGVELKILSVPENQITNKIVPPGVIFSPDGKQLYAMGRNAILVWESPLSGF